MRLLLILLSTLSLCGVTEARTLRCDLPQTVFCEGCIKKAIVLIHRNGTCRIRLLLEPSRIEQAGIAPEDLHHCWDCVAAGN